MTRFEGRPQNENLKEKKSCEVPVVLSPSFYSLQGAFLLAQSNPAFFAPLLIICDLLNTDIESGTSTDILRMTSRELPSGKTREGLWYKVEKHFLWPMASAFLIFVAYYVLVLHPKDEWSLLDILSVLFVSNFWWTGFKNRLSRFLRESLRQMMVEELAESRIGFVTWLREDAPWRGENPFIPPKQEESLPL